MSFKPIDGAKEDFRKYLDRKGVMDALTKAFVLCYDERPENPIERLVEVVADNAKILGASSELKSRLMNTELELKQARQEIDILRKQLTDLGVSPASHPSQVPSNSTNGSAISTLSAEAEKTTPSSNTSTVEAANHVNTGAIPKTPLAAATAPATNSTETTTQTSNEAAVTSNNSVKAEETTVATAATNTEESSVKQEATSAAAAT